MACSRGIVVAVFALLSAACFAQVMLKPNGEGAMPLRLKALKARVQVEKQIATTELELIFKNEVAERIEADFIYTLPEHSVATFFAYYYGKEQVVARVTEKERAAAVYQYITSRMRDPALVEMIGKRTFRARIFPIMPKEDLRVEMTLVQALPSDGSSYKYTLPLQGEKNQRLASIEVEIDVLHDSDVRAVRDNLGMRHESSQDLTSFVLKAKDHLLSKDLEITVEHAEKALQASLYSARSGGADGFFALQLMERRPGRREPVEISGVETYAVNNETVEAADGRYRLVTGRYRGSGPATVTLGALNAKVVFSSEAVENNAATKLWAAAEIERRAEDDKQRDAVIELSLRHGLPSKVTSWLAVPEEERVRYKREKGMAELSVLATEFVKSLQERSQTESTKGIESRMKALSTELDMDYQQFIRSAFYTVQDSLARDLAREIVANRGKSVKAGELRSQLKAIRSRGGMDEQSLLNAHLGRELYRSARILAPLRLDTPSERGYVALRGRVENLAKELKIDAKSLQGDGLIAEGIMLTNAVTELVGQPELNIEKLQQKRARIARIEQLTGQKPGSLYRRGRLVPSGIDVFSFDPTDNSLVEGFGPVGGMPGGGLPRRDGAAFGGGGFGGGGTGGTGGFTRESRRSGVSPIVESEMSSRGVIGPDRDLDLDSQTVLPPLPKQTPATQKVILCVEAPSDSQSAVGVLPNGDLVEMTYESDLRSWTATIQANAGELMELDTTPVVILDADGTSRALMGAFQINVTPSEIRARATIDKGLLSVEVMADERIEAVTAQLPWGRTIRLTESESGFWARVPVQIYANRRMPVEITILTRDGGKELVRTFAVET